MKHGVIILIFLFLIINKIVFCQTTLPEFIKLAFEKSYPSQIFNNQLQIAKLNYESFKLNNKPSLLFNGNAPVFNKDNFEVRQPDGTIKYLRRSQNSSNIGFSFTQSITATGGSVSLNTDLYRFDDFIAKSQLYNGTPVFIRLNQPLFAYNKLKWDKQIEPIKLREADLTLAISKHQLAYDVRRFFFDVIDAQVEKQLAASNFRNTNSNLAIEKRRLQLGISTEDKVLLLEIQKLNLLQQMETAVLRVQQNLLLLRSFINNTDTSSRQLKLPEQLTELILDNEKIILDAKQNLPFYLSTERKKLEAESNIAKIEAQSKQINLTASYGLNKAADNIPGIYRNPNDQQRFSISFSIPIADWGRRKNNLETERLQQKDVELNLKNEESKFITELSNLLAQIPILQNNISKSLVLDSLSKKRFEITNRLYQLDKASLLEVQVAQTEKDNAIRNYITAIRQYWEAYYLLKAKTGIDY